MPLHPPLLPALDAPTNCSLASDQKEGQRRLSGEGAGSPGMRGGDGKQGRMCATQRVRCGSEPWAAGFRPPEGGNSAERTATARHRHRAGGRGKSWGCMACAPGGPAMHGTCVLLGMHACSLTHTPSSVAASLCGDLKSRPRDKVVTLRPCNCVWAAMCTGTQGAGGGGEGPKAAHLSSEASMQPRYACIMRCPRSKAMQKVNHYWKAW